ncbi:hypothetical protein EDD11_000510 [Mortierella claussenii]|nr:hypothetical protein EDD11_000510 [Mortierella claussenii]
MSSEHQRQSFMSDSGLMSTMTTMHDDPLWTKDGRLQGDSSTATTKASGSVSTGAQTDEESPKTRKVSATLQLPEGRQGQAQHRTSVAGSQQTVTSSNMSTVSSGSEKSRMRSQSQLQSSGSSSHTVSGSTPGKPLPRTVSGPVTHAVPKKFFAKSNGSMFDLDNLATTIAKEHKPFPASPQSPRYNVEGRKGSSAGLSAGGRGDRDRQGQVQMRRSNSNSASSVASSRRSSGYMDDSRSARRIRQEMDEEEKNGKRRSLDSVLDVTSLAGNLASEDKTGGGSRKGVKSRPTPAPYSQPLYLYTNHTTTSVSTVSSTASTGTASSTASATAAESKPKREFLKIQTAKGNSHSYKPIPDKMVFDIRPEWTALDLGSRIGALGGSEGLLPPKMMFPVAQIVDHYFLLSGASVEEPEIKSGVPGSLNSAPQDLVGHHSFVGGTGRVPSETFRSGSGSTASEEPSSVGGGRRLSFSVWMHHFHNHQWTQLELSKSLRSGQWNQSVLDREGNFLYILGQRIPDARGQQQPQRGPTTALHQEPSSFTSWVDTPEEGAEAVDLGLSSSSAAIAAAAVVASFTHMVKVDLEGLEICPGVDESSVGPGGVRMGLEMLRDGVGADVVLVSSADGGRVRVNSGIVGQRWGYFQALMEERDRMRQLEVQERLKKRGKEAEGVEKGLQQPEELPQQEPSSNSRNGSRRGSTASASASVSGSAKGSPASPTSLKSKQWYLNDHPAEILVRESTPILVGFLQYIYTNELITPHQLKLKTLQGLLLVSHLYDLTRLQQLVRRALYQQLNASNAPAICEVAVLTHEFGLQTRALRTLLQSARLAQLRRQGEAAEAKRRLDFAMSRLEEIEEDRKRKASMQANQLMLQQSQGGMGSGSGGMYGMLGGGGGGIGSSTSGPIPRGAGSISGSGIMAGGSAAILRSPGAGSSVGIAGMLPSSNPGSGTTGGNGSGTSTPGLSSIGRFFRHREESVESAGPML